MKQLLDRLAVVAKERCSGAGPAHDALHVRRVARIAGALARAEQAPEDVAVAAALLHEVFNYPKNHPESARSGEVCAEHAAAILRDEQCPASFADAVCYAIRVHPFSLGIVPETVEAKILQDADRLDAIGAIGIARCFATSAEMQRPFYRAEDPFCRHREPDDKSCAVDHFYRKLLRIPEALHTPSARRMGEERASFLRQYLTQLEGEI